MMTREQFIEKVSEADDTDIDSLCFEWLRSYCPEFGQSGQWAYELLGLVEEMMR